MTSTESMRLRRYLISFASLLLILVMYYGWACFVPNLSDPYYDLGRIYYYSFLIPAGAAYPVVPGAPKYGILMGRREGRGKWTLNGQSALAYRIPTGIYR